MSEPKWLSGFQRQSENNTKNTIINDDVVYVHNRVFRDRQIWQICQIWQKWNAIFKNNYNLFNI